MFIPFVVVFFLGTQGIFTFTIGNLLIFSFVIFFFDLGLFFVSKSIFKREEILTKWK
jgi:hypothetical protein